jgi:hypothetical protein
VPQVVAALLAPLTKLSYQTLALEVPADQQTSITAWATGRSDTVPNFYAKPITDGRGNEQMLTLIRMALSPPYGWKLICFDQSDAESQQQYERLKQKVGAETLKNPPASVSQAVWQERDAAMASNFEKQFQQLGPPVKVLAICGDAHATTQHFLTINPPNSSETINLPNPFWPSFAAVVQSSHPNLHVSSIDVRPHSAYRTSWTPRIKAISANRHAMPACCIFLKAPRQRRFLSNW